MELYSVMDDPKLKRGLTLLANRIRHYLPFRILNHEDLMQIGWLAILSVPLSQYPDDPNYLLRRMLTVGRNRMISAVREISDNRFPTGRRLEYLSPDISLLQELSSDGNESAEDDYTRQHDAPVRLNRLHLEPRTKQIVWWYVHGVTLLEIAKRLHLSEGRISQLISNVTETLLRQEDEEL